MTDTAELLFHAFIIVVVIPLILFLGTLPIAVWGRKVGLHKVK